MIVKESDSRLQSRRSYRLGPRVRFALSVGPYGLEGLITLADKFDDLPEQFVNHSSIASAVLYLALRLNNARFRSHTR